MKAVAALVVVLTTAACSFEFERTLHVEPGSVTGTAARLDEDKKPAPFAQVAVQGGSIVRRTFGDGTFAVKGLGDGPWILRFADDADADGYSERTAFSAARIVAGPDGNLSSVLLGTVGLDGSFDVSGTVGVVGGAVPVTPSSLGELARVVLTRELCVPTDPNAFTLECGQALADRISVGVEAEAGVDDTGAFALPQVGSGTVFLYALLFLQAPGGALGQLVAISQPVQIDGKAGDVKDAGAVVIDPIAGAVTTVTTTIALTPAPTEDVRLLFATPGAPARCDGTGAATGVQEIDVANPSGDPATSVSVDAPAGIVDVTACVGDAQGFLAEALVVPPVDADDPAALGPILLRVDDPCVGGDGVRDCDGDGLAGLPPLVAGAAAFAADTALWSQCASSCAQAFGSSNASCNASGAGSSTVFDCDDDGDGQPDVTESPACYGLGLGTDYDGDGLCSGADPFPTCAANDPALCKAGDDVRGGARNLLDDICEVEPPFPVPTCAHITALDENGTDNFDDGAVDEIDGHQIDGARGQVVRFTIEVGGVLQLVDHDTFLPDGNFTWTKNDLHVGFPDYEIWFRFDGAGRTLEFTDYIDDDNDAVVDSIVRALFVPGRTAIVPRNNGNVNDAASLEAVRYESDDSGCKPARVLYFSYDDNNVPTHVDADDDADGVVDRSLDVADDGGCGAGFPCTEVITDPISGAVTQLQRGDDGRVTREDTDFAGDGTFETFAVYSPTEFDDRPGFDRQPLLLQVGFDTDGDNVIDRQRDFVRDADDNIVASITRVDRDGSGTFTDALNEFDFASELRTTTRIKFQFDGDLDGVADSTDVTELAALDAVPPFTFQTFSEHNDSASDTAPFDVTTTWSLADSCALDPTVNTACVADADCAGAPGTVACNVLAPAPDDSVEGFSLTRFCGPVAGGARADHGTCSGALFNNVTCASGLCDDSQTGQCTHLCTVDGDCAATDVCVGVDAFGVKGTGLCQTPCARQLDCTSVDAGRSCVPQHRHADGSVVGVCDGNRGFAPPGQPGDTSVVGATSCLTHVMIDPSDALHANVCTELCSAAGADTDCDDLSTGNGGTCSATAAVDFAGAAVNLTICVPR